MDILILVFFILAILGLGIKIVRPVESGIIEFLGKYSRTAGAGFNWIVPGLHKIYRVNITERRVDIGLSPKIN